MTILDQLDETLAQRKQAHADDSYVASLYAQGTNKILEKIAEEATEVLLAAKDLDDSEARRRHLIGEVADLWFHTLILLSHEQLSSRAVLDELTARFGVSGHEEKATRGR